jgi:hypothetical protein
MLVDYVWEFRADRKPVCSVQRLLKITKGLWLHHLRDFAYALGKGGTVLCFERCWPAALSFFPMSSLCVPETYLYERLSFYSFEDISFQR